MDKCYDLPSMKKGEKTIDQSLSCNAQSYYKDWDSAKKHIETSNCPSLPKVEIDPKEKAQTWHDAQEKADVHNKELFAQVDTNHDGRLTMDELKSALRNDQDLSLKDGKELEGAAQMIAAQRAAMGPLAWITDMGSQVSEKEFLNLNRPVF